ncbi:AbrB/MazE/SpoVT family DNA-binding domain-containing protein [Candidatus Pacearchaeota archaeon]|nr:AbrB/MazE/SpoVT family DNA-binding domain-containing protein [Candidatus Pacearchaeota archaeon]
MEMATTTLSSKGQIVIPSIMRVGFKEGEKLLLIQEDDSIILKKVSSLQENFKDDLEFARRTREAQESIDEGEYIEVDSDNLEAEMDKW